MEYAKEYEKFLREKLNGMTSKGDKISYLISILDNLDSCPPTRNTHFNEVNVLEKLLKEIRGWSAPFSCARLPCLRPTRSARKNKKSFVYCKLFTWLVYNNDI